MDVYRLLRMPVYTGGGGRVQAAHGRLQRLSVNGSIFAVGVPRGALQRRLRTRAALKGQETKHYYLVIVKHFAKRLNEGPRPPPFFSCGIQWHYEPR